MRSACATCWRTCQRTQTKCTSFGSLGMNTGSFCDMSSTDVLLKMISRTHKALLGTPAKSQRKSTAKRSTQRTKLLRRRHQFCEMAACRMISTHMGRVRRVSAMTVFSGANCKVKMTCPLSMTLSATSHRHTTSSSVLFNTEKAAVGFPPAGTGRLFDDDAENKRGVAIADGLSYNDVVLSIAISAC